MKNQNLATWMVVAMGWAGAVGLAQEKDVDSYLLAESDRDGAVEQAILDAHPDYTREMVQSTGQTARYLYNRVDLNEDGEDEIFVYLLGSFFCGTGGCNLLILQRADDGFAVLDSFPTSRVPLMVRNESTNGWRDLVRLSSGGGAPPGYHLLKFNGEHYLESETTGAQTAFQGKAVLADELTAELGIPLEPQP